MKELSVKPYYRAEDLEGIAGLNAVPGEFPYRRGAQATGGWQIREEIEARDRGDEANRAACAAAAARSGGDCIQRALSANSAELEVAARKPRRNPVHFEYADGAADCGAV